MAADKKPKKTKPSIIAKESTKDQFASPSDLVAELSDRFLTDMLPLIQVRLKKFDGELNDTLRRKLAICILGDMDDPEKRTPGLYQAILRLLNDPVQGLEENMISGSKVDELNLPFKPPSS